MLPASSSGILAYADYGASCTNSANALWIPLIEKAYAQWNETGKEGRDGTNAFASIQGGWMATVDAQVLGYNATDYIMTTTAQQVAINALAAHQAVTIGTQNWSAATNLGLYANHAYAITGYNRRDEHVHALQSLGLRISPGSSPGHNSRRHAPSSACAAPAGRFHLRALPRWDRAVRLVNSPLGTAR